MAPRKLIPLSIAMCTDHTVRRYRRRLYSLGDSYRGRRCFIMGSGPSLNKMNLDRLKDESVWGMNRCSLLFDRISWRPAFYTAVDTRVVPDNSKEINQLIKELPKTLFFFPVDFCLCKVLFSAPNTYWYNEIAFDDGDLPDGYFSASVPDFVRATTTVTAAAMQIAVFLGFNPIYLIGCDTDYRVPDSVQYEDEDLNLIVGTSNDDVSHFDPAYFGTGKKYHQPRPERMIFGYEQARKVCDRLGVKILNATTGGKLEVFPRVEFNSLF